MRTFLVLSALAISFILFSIYRYRTRNLLKINAALSEAKKAREERLAELQKVRTRIATDLHDDIGSSLTQIAVFSEVARQRERENGHHDWKKMRGGSGLHNMRRRA